MNSPQLVTLLHLCDPALPIGGFSHSSGLETYVQLGIVHDKGSAAAFIRTQLSQNIFFTDAALVSLAFDAASTKDEEALVALDEECHAVKLPREMREMSQKLGLRLLKIFAPLCKSGLLDTALQWTREGRAAGHYPVAFGMVADSLCIAKADALTGFFYNAAAGMVTNCVKLVPLGQLDGQAILFSLHPLMESLALASLTPDRDKIGLCCAGFDIRCMQHERLYSRLYMS
jgi:urease accessory protein